MICPKCQVTGEKSTVHPGMAVTTLMHYPPYYDEAGKMHHHDMNRSSQSYSCSNGHHWTEQHKHRCPNVSCDWVQT